MWPPPTHPQKIWISTGSTSHIYRFTCRLSEKPSLQGKLMGLVMLPYFCNAVLSVGDRTLLLTCSLLMSFYESPMFRFTQTSPLIRILSASCIAMSVAMFCGRSMNCMNSIPSVSWPYSYFRPSCLFGTFYQFMALPESLCVDEEKSHNRRNDDSEPGPGSPFYQIINGTLSWHVHVL